jgi:hypothetical protein
VRVRVIRNTISEVRTRGDVRESAARQAIARDDDDDLDDEGGKGEVEEKPAAEKTGPKAKRA